MQYLWEYDVIFSNFQPRIGTRKINGGHTFREIKAQKTCVLYFAIDWNLARYPGKTYCVQKCQKMDIENLIIGALLILSLLWWCMYRVYFVARIVMNITVQTITFLVWGSVWLSFPKSFYILKLICAPYFILKKQHFINWLTQIDGYVFSISLSVFCILIEMLYLKYLLFILFFQLRKMWNEYARLDYISFPFFLNLKY